MPELDFGNIYSPNGTIIQHRYAQKAVDAGSTMVAMRNTKGAVLLVSKQIVSNLHVLESDYRVKRVASNVYMSYTGVLTDGGLIYNWCKKAVADYEENFRAEITANYFKKILSEYLYIFTSNIGIRVIGASFFVIVKEKDEYVLLYADLTGKVIRWNACACGIGERRAFTELEKLNFEDLSLDEMVEQGIKILYKSFDPLSDIKFGIEVVKVGFSTENEFIRLKNPDIEHLIEKYQNMNVDD